MPRGEGRRVRTSGLSQLSAPAGQTGIGIEEVRRRAPPKFLHHRRPSGRDVDPHQIGLRHTPHDALGESEEAGGWSTQQLTDRRLVANVMAEHEDRVGGFHGEGSITNEHS